MSDAPKKKFDPRAGLDKLIAQLTILKRYSFLIFIVFVAGLYSFLLFRINGLSSQQPTQDAINSQVKAAAIPHIDQSVVQQLQSLQDNSVSVKALFNDARNNPFKE